MPVGGEDPHVKGRAGEEAEVGGRSNSEHSESEPQDITQKHTHTNTDISHMLYTKVKRNGIYQGSTGRNKIRKRLESKRNSS